MNVRPLGDRILIRRVDAEEKIGSIIVPEKARDKPLVANVIAVGAGIRLESGTLIPLEVKPGDQVYIAKYSGTEVKIDGIDHLIITESEVLGIVSA
jgi:chaperonin GroES